MASTVMAFRSFFLVMIIITIGLFAIRGTAENHLLAGDKLKTGENISDINYSLKMQEDCNLVLYQRNPEKALWYTQTNGKGTRCELSLQADGNLAIHDDKQNLVWETKTNRVSSGSYVLLLQRDRNLVIYATPKWFSGSQV